MTRKALALLTLVCACVVAVPGTAHAASSRQIIQDCSADDVLQGTYTAAELRKARGALDGDTLEYTKCDSVLSRALLALQQARNREQTPGAPPPTGDFSAGTPAGEVNPNDLPTQFDKFRLDRAAESGDTPVEVGDVKLVPASGVRVDTSGLPAPLIVALAVLALTGLAAAFPGVRAQLARVRRRR